MRSKRQLSLDLTGESERERLSPEMVRRVRELLEQLLLLAVRSERARDESADE
jgi:hypothetical protein